MIHSDGPTLNNVYTWYFQLALIDQFPSPTIQMIKFKWWFGAELNPDWLPEAELHPTKYIFNKLINKEDAESIINYCSNEFVSSGDICFFVPIKNYLSWSKMFDQNLKIGNDNIIFINKNKYKWC